MKLNSTINKAIFFAIIFGVIYSIRAINLAPDKEKVDDFIEHYNTVNEKIDEQIDDDERRKLALKTKDDWILGQWSRFSGSNTKDPDRLLFEKNNYVILSSYYGDSKAKRRYFITGNEISIGGRSLVLSRNASGTELSTESGLIFTFEKRIGNSLYLKCTKNSLITRMVRVTLSTEAKNHR